MKSQHYKEAEELFVKKGLSLNSVAKAMEGKVSRRTIYNWAKKEDWETKRRKQLIKKETLEEELWELLRQSIDEAKTNPNPRTIFAVAKLAGVLKTLSNVEFDKKSEEENKPKTITQDTVEEIKKLLGIN